MKVVYFVLLAGSLVACFASCNGNSGRQESASTAEEIKKDEVKRENQWSAEEEATFLEEAYLTNLTILGYSEVAYRKANTLALRDFANQSVSYYKNLNAQIERMGNKYAIAWEDGAEKGRDNDWEELQKKEGKELEEAYIKNLKAILEKQINAFEDASVNAPEDQIRNWTAKIAANLKAHFTAVEELQEDI